MGQDCVNLLVFLFVSVTLNIRVMSGNQAGRHTYVVRYKHGDTLIPVTVVLDYKRQTEYVINMNSRTPAKSVTLYDFKERVIAYKDLKNGECFIGRLTHETIQNEDAILKRLKSPVEDKPLILTIDNNRPSLTPTEVRNMAGHKAAVFCRRMNTWTLLHERENRRERRDTLSHVDRISAGYDEHTMSKHVSRQRNELLEGDNLRMQMNRTAHRTLPNQRTPDHLEAAPSLQPSVVHPSVQHHSLPNVYPFILSRQRSVPQQAEDRRGSRQNFSIHNASRKHTDDSSPHFSFVNGRPSVRRYPEFSQHLSPPGLDNGTTLIPSKKHAFVPLNTNRPLIISSISAPNKFPESNLHYGSSQISSPGTFPGGSPQSNFRTLHSRGGESIENYSPFQQLPPEAFILPLTRSATVTTAPFVLSNRLGYELVQPDGFSTSNSTLIQTSLDVTSAESAHDGKIVPTGPDHSVLNVRSDSISSSDNHNIPASSRNISVPSGIHAISKSDDTSFPQEKSSDHQLTEAKTASFVSTRPNGIRLSPSERLSNETEKSSTGANTTSTSHFDNAKLPTVERGDLPIDLPQWYPEVTKQISIPLEIEVLHHREEYVPNISNRTDEVHSLRGHETEDHTFLPSAKTIIPIPVETYSNGLRFDKEVKLLPQVSSIPDEESVSRDTLKQDPDRTDKKQDKKIEYKDSTGSRYPIHSSDVSNTTLHRSSSTPYASFRNNTETASSGTDSHYISKQTNQIAQPAFSHERNGTEGRRTPKRQYYVNEGSVPVHDFKIDEGVPSYRKRYPAVTQLFTPEETVGDIGRLPDQPFHSGQQNPFRRRRPSAYRNKTHRVPSHRQQAATPWRKYNHEVPRSFIHRQQTRLSDQGITFHHRGYPKTGVPGAPYDHHRKRFGVLPPGVSVHPRHPQAPYADLALGTVDKTIPVNTLLQPRPRRMHLRHHRRHQRKRNRVLPPPDSGVSAPSCCGSDGLNCCSGSRRGKHFAKNGCCSQIRESRRPNSVLPPQNDGSEVSPKKQGEDVEEDRCMKEKMCRTVYQSTKKVFVCRNIEVGGC